MLQKEQQQVTELYSHKAVQDTVCCWARYGQQKLGWAKEKLDDLLLPVLRRMGQKQRQVTMLLFFCSYL